LTSVAAKRQRRWPGAEAGAYLGTLFLRLLLLLPSRTG
jgi:hypothetical protein